MEPPEGLEPSEANSEQIKDEVRNLLLERGFKVYSSPEITSQYRQERLDRLADAFRNNNPRLAVRAERISDYVLKDGLMDPYGTDVPLRTSERLKLWEEMSRKDQESGLSNNEDIGPYERAAIDLIDQNPLTRNQVTIVLSNTALALNAITNDPRIDQNEVTRIRQESTQFLQLIGAKTTLGADPASENLRSRYQSLDNEAKWKTIEEVKMLGLSTLRLLTKVKPAS